MLQQGAYRNPWNSSLVCAAPNKQPADRKRRNDGGAFVDAKNSILHVEALFGAPFSLRGRQLRPGAANQREQLTVPKAFSLVVC